MGLEIGMALHQDARLNGYTPYVYVATALLTMYGKFGRLVEAEDIFHNLSEPTIVSWTAMLSAFVEQGGYGKKVGALVHSYASCGSMADAYAVFDELVQPNVVAWSGCMAGCAGDGNSTASLGMLEAMRLSGISPNDVTFTSVLSACSHSGLATEGLEYFDSLGKDYGIDRELKHYVYMTDLLGRAGNFNKLEDILNRMPMKPNLTIWLCLLGMSLRHGNAELGKQAFIHATNLEPRERVSYILMSNIYAESASEMTILGRVEDSWP
ncbi:hypothetical protein GOP47_0018121 [Adiantum capillus-veneris]|uniref:Pentatricopeptide repeat-containing protein n=1 Tax=Adiantum capillus-veneris TaxID=13818 RepID=A0A9D4UHM8_ADICA|nr:hypothetical protein GOP47_0018121 [Adiantum capillus-veneris]